MNLIIKKIADNLFTFNESSNGVNYDGKTFGGSNLNLSYTNNTLFVSNTIERESYDILTEVKYDNGSEIIGFSSVEDFISTLKSEGFTGNFNSPQAGGNCIPLTGTEEGKPVTGPITYDYNNNVSFPLQFLAKDSDNNLIGTTGLKSEQSEEQIVKVSLSNLYKKYGGDYTEAKFGLKHIGQSVTYESSIPLRGEEFFDEIESQDKLMYAQRSYVDKSNSYSTDEVLTGGTWIDGKPIYRKVIVGYQAYPVSGDPFSLNHNLFCQSLITIEVTLSSGLKGNLFDIIKFLSPNTSMANSNIHNSTHLLGVYQVGDTFDFESNYIILEYTKAD